MCSAGVMTSAQMGSGAPPDACPLFSSLKALGSKAAEHLKRWPETRSNPYLSVLTLTKSCWRAERHSSAATRVTRDSESERKHKQLKSVHVWDLVQIEHLLSYPMRGDDQHPEMNLCLHLNWEKMPHNLWSNHILHPLFSVLLILHCIIIYINIYSYSEWLG